MKSNNNFGKITEMKNQIVHLMETHHINNKIKYIL